LLLLAAYGLQLAAGGATHQYQNFLILPLLDKK
jgi:hypothetical protein